LLFISYPATITVAISSPTSLPRLPYQILNFNSPKKSTRPDSEFYLSELDSDPAYA
jgi:hypothetical protein